MALVKKEFGEIFDFTRASTATYWDSNGVLQTAAVDEPRFDHDPVTGEALGVLIEDSATNELTYSEDFDNVAWGKVQTTVAPNEITAPDGSLSADKVSLDSSDSIHFVTRSGVMTASNTWAGSVFVKAGEWGKFGIGDASAGDFVRADLSDGSFSVDPGLDSGFVEDVGGGWYKVGFSFTAPSNRTFGIALLGDALENSFQGDGSSGLYIWGAQLEKGTRPSSYIPTSGSPATRAADNLSRGLGAEFNSNEGSIFVEIYSRTDGSASPILLVSDSAAAQGQERFIRVVVVSGSLFLGSGGNLVNLGSAAAAGIIVGVNKIAVSWANGLANLYVNGALSGSVAIDDTGHRVLWVGRDGSDRYSDGPVHLITVYPFAMSQPELEGLTS